MTRDTRPSTSTPERNTRQREAIRAAIGEAGAPVSAREVLTLARARSRRLGLATVYRTLRLLIDAGEVAPVEIAGQPPRYELAGKGHHHHFHCVSCGKVFELEGCCGHFEELAPVGFAVLSHDLTLSGTCRECGVKGRMPARRPRRAC